MPPVIHPIWLLLLLCGLVLLGCSALSSRTPTLSVTSPYPPVTLTVYRFSATPAPALLNNPPLPVTPIMLSSAASPPTPSLEADTPACYARPGGALTCTGAIWNRSTQPLTDVRLRVALRPAEMTPAQTAGVLAQTALNVEQQYIAPGTFAPYRALFETLPEQTFRAETQVLSAAFTEEETLPLHIYDETGQLNSSGQYVLTAQIENSATLPLESLRVIVTLLDDANRVLGYRVQTLPRLEATEQQLLRVQLTPQRQTETIRHTLHIERF
jgi:hypothetical protein